jgi:hypothetical protein
MRLPVRLPAGRAAGIQVAFEIVQVLRDFVGERRFGGCRQVEVRQASPDNVPPVSHVRHR